MGEGFDMRKGLKGLSRFASMIRSVIGIELITGSHNQVLSVSVNAHLKGSSVNMHISSLAAQIKWYYVLVSLRSLLAMLLTLLNMIMQDW